MNEILDIVYKNMINIIIQDFNDNECEEIKEAYKNYLLSCYKNSLNLTDDINKLINHFIKLERLKWEDKTKEIKQVLLLEDKSFDELRNLSSKALEYATLKIMGKENEIDLTKQQAIQYISKMNECFSKVREFNKEAALLQLSEATLDFEYAVGLEENTSLRIGGLR